MAQSSEKLHLTAGLGDGVVTLNEFRGDRALPEGHIRVEVGTTVVWTVGSDEEHTVSFLAGRPRPARFIPQPEDPAGRPLMENPDVSFPTAPIGRWDGTTYVNSGPLGRGTAFSLTFAREGIYPYVCLLHPRMTGSVQVVPAGSAGITVQDERLTATRMPDVHARQVEQLMANRSHAVAVEGPLGATTWFARAGTDWRDGRLDLMAFLPDELAVRQGDTVVWYNDHPSVPHTVTFTPLGQEEPDFLLLMLPDGTPLRPGQMGDGQPGLSLPSMLEAGIGPRLVLGPGALPARPAGAYDGVSFFNSGILGDLDPRNGNAWALTFDRPGTFDYLCVIHDPLGMTGTITVLPR